MKLFRQTNSHLILQISGFALRARTVVMEKARRNAYDAAFKLKAIRLAIKEGNRAAAQTLGVNESMVRRWRGQREELTRCKKRTKAFRGNKSRWPELENVLEDWVNTQRARGRSVSTVQIRLKAKTIATEKNIEHFRGGPSWCFRFMQRKGLFVRERTTPRQQLPPDLKDKIANFSEFTHRNIAENSIGPDDVINMDEVPLTFNLPLTRTVLQKGESSVTLKTTGHERTHFTCVLSCTASGLKLPPMVIFKRVTMPKEKFPKGIAVKVNKKGWMIERLMKKWLNECYGKRPGGFRHRKRALLVLDSTRAHMTDSVKAAIKMTNTIPAVIPEGTRKYLQPLDISVNRAFKLALRVQWEAWMTSSKKSFAETGRMRRATFSQVCQWILTAWSNVKESTITDAFQKAGLLRDEEEEEEDGGGGESSRADSPREESDTESTNKRGTECNEALLRLFNSDTEEEDFNGFSAQEDDGDSDQ
uniref:HTH CENPB-type domain-containing protein n=1 Tax=Gasterosteus aculeatus aculeatus TaxID=481459 RepID=A0AAQ4RF46_GASAC